MKKILSLLFLSFGVWAQDISETRLQRHILSLTAVELEGRACGTPGERKAAEYIRTQLQKVGLAPLSPYSNYFQPFSVRPEHVVNHPAILTQNVVGWIDNQAPTTVILGGHYDHLGRGEWDGSMEVGSRGQIHPGADDNASGVAGLLELAKNLAQNGITEKHNYIFVFFGAEEIGLQGSRYFVQNMPITQDQIHYMLNVDMIGRFSPERQLIVRGHESSSHWTKVLHGSTSSSGLPIRPLDLGIYSSDHLPFLWAKIPVLTVSTGVHEDYHKPTDTEDKIDYFRLRQIVGWIHQVIWAMENETVGHFQRIPSPDQTVINPLVSLGFIPDYRFSDKGVKVDYVTRNRPACQAGIQPGDVLIRLKDIPIYSIRDYLTVMNQLHAGEKVEVILRREDTQLALHVAL